MGRLLRLQVTAHTLQQLGGKFGSPCAIRTLRHSPGGPSARWDVAVLLYRKPMLAIPDVVFCTILPEILFGTITHNKCWLVQLKFVKNVLDFVISCLFYYNAWIRCDFYFHWFNDTWVWSRVFYACFYGPAFTITIQKLNRTLCNLVWPASQLFQFNTW